MKVSIIIVNYNTKSLITQCLDSIYKYVVDVSFEVIVVYNGSSDGSPEFIKAHFSKVILIESPVNIGFGRANNLGINISQGEYIFLLNSDTYLLDNAVIHFISYMDENRNAACCGADLIDINGGRQISFGNFPSLFEAFSQLGFLAFYRDYFKKHLASAVINYDDHVKEVDYICGADMFIRKSVLEQVGNFDPVFFLYFEETELSYRFRKGGYSSVLLPSVKIVHLEGGSQQTDTSFNYNKIRLFAASRNIFFKKCYGGFSAIIGKMFFTLHALSLFVLKRKSGHLKSAKIIINS